MTRINAGIPVEDLTREHLIAEHREITRIPNAIKRGKYNMKNCPEEFTLGKGHVKFFYNKLLYLKRRYLNLFLECKRRGYNVTNKMDAFIGLPDQLMNDYKPTDKDKDIVNERITLRLKEFHKKKQKKLAQKKENN